MFILICSILAGIVIWRGILPLKLAKTGKAVLIFLTVVSAYNFIIRRMFHIENLPVPLLLTAAWLFSVLIIFCVLLICREIFYWLCCGVCFSLKRKVPSWMEKNGLRLVLFAGASFLTVWGMISALGMPQVREYEIYLDTLPAELDGMTIAQLSDIHADSITGSKKIEAIVKRTNTLHADVVVITGDIVDRRVDIGGDELKSLGDLRARWGVYGVPGNHEYYSGYEKWMHFFRSIGIEMLENRHAVIADGKVVIGGTTDRTAGKMKLEMPDVKKSFAGAPAGALRILLAHQPKIAAMAAKEGVALQISGHTHGGMMLGMDMIIAAFNHFMVSGEYYRNGMKIFVSNGSGIWSGFPVRLGRPAEIALLRLRSKNK